MEAGQRLVGLGGGHAQRDREIALDPEVLDDPIEQVVEPAPRVLQGAATLAVLHVDVGSHRAVGPGENGLDEVSSGMSHGILLR